jgi:hypothetical protein
MNLPNPFMVNSYLLEKIKEAVKNHANDADLGQAVRSLVNNVFTLDDNPVSNDQNIDEN